MSDETKPNFTRYQRVADVIATEPALAARMGGKTEIVLKPNGDKVEFPKEVIAVTERIHAVGDDANTYGKDKIVQLAIDVIVCGGNGTPEPATKSMIDSGVLKRKKRGRKAAVRKPVIKKEVAASGVLKDKKSAKKNRLKSDAEAVEGLPVKPEEQKIEAPPAAESKTKEVEVARPKRVNAPPVEPVTVEVVSPPSQAQNSPVPFAIGCAVNSNLICASQLLEIHDRTLEGKEIRERLDKIIDEINRRTVIPCTSRS